MKNFEDCILKLIKKKSYGLSINEIADELDVYRATVAKYLKGLEKKRKIQVRKVGRAKLHYPKGVLG